MFCEKCGKELKEGQVCQICVSKKMEEGTIKNSSRGVGVIKKVLNAFCWLLIGILLLTGISANSGMGTSKDGIIEIISYYLIIVCNIIIPLGVLMNFNGVRNKLPLFKKHKFFVSIFAFFCMITILGMVSVFAITLMDEMHTAEYRSEYEEQQVLLKAEAEKKAEQEKVTEVSDDEMENSTNDYKEVDAVEYEEEIYQEEFHAQKEYAEHEANESESIIKDDVSVYSLDYVAEYIEKHNIEIPKERYKNKINKALTDNSEMIAVEADGGSKVRYSATNYEGEFYYVGKMKNNVPNGWGKIIRVVQVSEMEYYGYPLISIDSIAWGWSDEDMLVPVLVYVGEFEDGYYSGYGWKYADHFEVNDIYKSKISYEYVETTDDLMENILMNCNPVEYMGEFKKGLFDGDGIWITYGAREIPFEMTDEQQIETWGTIIDKEIEFYIGEFKKGELRGEAKHYLLGNLRYEGGYHDWSYDGEGTLYYIGTTQKMYDGEWSMGEYHGKGTLYNEDGSIKYKGKWVRGDYAN